MRLSQIVAQTKPQGLTELFPKALFGSWLVKEWTPSRIVATNEYLDLIPSWIRLEAQKGGLSVTIKTDPPSVFQSVVKPICPCLEHDVPKVFSALELEQLLSSLRQAVRALTKKFRRLGPKNNLYQVGTKVVY